VYLTHRGSPDSITGSTQEVRLSRTIQIFLAAIAIAIIAQLGVGLFEGELSDEDQIRAVIQQVATGAENADIVMCMEPFSPRYEDADGLEKRSINGILWQHFRKRGPISVWMGDVSVEVTNNEAIATFDVGLTEGTEGSMVPWPVSADILNFELDFAREEGEWRITNHSRRPAVISPSAG
jgi:hypothetical protein